MKKNIFVVLSLTFLLSACTIYPIKLNLNGSSVLNTDKSYKSLPVKVSIFQLRSKDKFLNANDAQLLKNPRQTLGNDFVSLQIVGLRPSEQKILTIRRQPKTKYIGISPNYSVPHSSQGRIVVDVSKLIPFVPKRILISLVENRIYAH